MVRNVLALAGVVALLGCESDEIVIPVTTGEVITLTQAQAATLVSRMQSFSSGSTDPTLAALSDSARFVLKAGAEARQISVTTDLGAGPYWAVSIHRTRVGTGTSPQSWSTFNVIAFNEPNDPTRFIVLGGFNQVSGTTPPTSVSGPIGGASNSSLTAHLFSVSGSQVSAWHASAGTSSLVATPSSETCAGFSASGMTCVKSTMTANFNITTTVPGNGATGSRTMSTASAQTAPGIKLAF